MKRLFLMVCLSVLVLPQCVFAASLKLDGGYISAQKKELRADGIDNTLVTVKVEDTNLAPIGGVKVVLSSSRGTADTIRVVSDSTTPGGLATFRVSSLQNGVSVYSYAVDGTQMPKTVSITYTGGLIANINAGDLIKIPDDSNAATLSDTAVYFYASNGRRYVFPNEKVYFTWYPDFTQVKILAIDQMSLIPIGGNVTYKAASKLVKFQTDTKTYLPTRFGVLRWVTTEDVARSYFGTAWNTSVDDISEAFYVNYRFGTPISNPLDAALDILRTSGASLDLDVTTAR